MTWRAHIQDDFAARDLRVHLIDDWQGGYTLLGKGGDSRVVVTSPNDAAPELPEPALILPSGADHALFAALSRHLGAVEHPEQLRRDYEAERKRVDLFIAHLTRGAQ